MSEPFLGGILLDPSTFETLMGAFITDQSVGRRKIIYQHLPGLLRVWFQGAHRPEVVESYEIEPEPAGLCAGLRVP
jgi:hypothetical protein